MTVAIGHGKKAARNIDAWLRGTHYQRPAQHELAGYDKLNTCACVNKLSAGGCADVCDMKLNMTTTPNFCDHGKTPNMNTSTSSCFGCLMANCASEISDCKSN